MRNEATIRGITVGGQPDADEIRRFATVVNLRLPGEPGNDSAALVEGTDVAYRSVPVTIETITKADVAQIRDAMDSSSGPVLVH
jgi:protein tyrosine phosphatase (PTP) superfamily phosphohydrolase (DUF442 family)